MEQYAVTVVIPAHNEEAVLGRCLTNLTTGEGAEHLNVIVVCNGCKDKTADIARQFQGVKVVEIAKASKIAALNEGDLNVSDYPVAYIDADVQLSASDVLDAARKLKEPVKIVAPRTRVDLSRSSVLVKAFYSVWLKLPYFKDMHMVGSGVYILSKDGRQRFRQFPDIISDDGYVRSLFSDHERLTAANCSFTIYAPTNIRSLIKIKTRSRLGNMQVSKLYPKLQVGGENTSSAFISLMLQKPWLLPSGMVYAMVQWLTKYRAAQKLSQDDTKTWERDHSTRA